MDLTHIDEKGAARMVDVSEKQPTKREAKAQAVVKMRPETLSLILTDQIKKGDVFATARIAGIMAAKKTSEIIPLCHPIPITSVSVEIVPEKPDTVVIEATVGCKFETGVEMEALHAASAAALTLYDMCKAVDRGMEIVSIRLLEKSGGRSGHFVRKEDPSIVAFRLKKGAEVSMLDTHAKADMQAVREQGLCMKKFKADIETKNTDFDKLSVGDTFEIGGYGFTVTRKKECFEDCALHNSGQYCPLKHGCIFAEVTKTS
jgi:cyclic pyranopterin monophosphate synthase